MEYELLLAALGAVGIVAALLPRLVGAQPLSFPIYYVAGGAALAFVPLGVTYDPQAYPVITERLTELGVILALTGSGLKMDRAIGWGSWGTTWRLLGITMPLTVAAAAGLAVLAGFPLVSAVLVGAVLAPTDPVLASDVQAPRPGDERPSEETEVRFALTSEAGLNDGLAFPFTYLAIAVLAGGGIVDWLLVDVGYRIFVGLVMGIVTGRLLALAIFKLPRSLSASSQGFVVIAMTLVTYGVTQLLGGYGFIAVFVAAVAFRSWEKRHRFHRVLHDASEQAERSVLALLLVLFGAALATGLLAALTWPMALAGCGVVLVVRPVVGWLGMLGLPLAWPQRAAISFFGIRGIGSFYYLSFALNRGDFPAAEAAWAFIGFVVLVSIVVHGISAKWAMRRLSRGAPA